VAEGLAAGAASGRIDPAFNIIRPLHCDLHLVRATSDDFFATPDPIEHLRRGRSRVAGYQSLRREITALASTWPKFPPPSPAAEAHGARRAARRAIPRRIRSVVGLPLRFIPGVARRLRR
jgi:hypothetical protein